MGGLGSGPRFWHWWKPPKKRVVEGCLAIDVHTWMRAGVLQGEGHQIGGHRWKHPGHKAVTIGYEVDLRDPDAPRLVLSYGLKDGRRSASRSVRYAVRLTATAPHFGGQRWWFLCPLVGCGLRVGKLYLPAGATYFGCRHCYDLTYRSSQEAKAGGAFFSRLAGEAGLRPGDLARLLRDRGEGDTDFS